MKYNYVVLGNNEDLYLVSYNDLSNRDDAVYLKDPIDTNNGILRALNRFHTSPRINRILHLPCQSIWNKFVFKNHFKDSKPICFIFFTSRTKEIHNGLILYLKKNYENCKVVIFYQDIVARSIMPDIEENKKRFDLVLSFDQSDSRKYNVLYYPLVYSKIDIPAPQNHFCSDIYFVGKAKDRLNKILAAYEVFRNAGLKCDFHIIGAKPEERRYKDEISYEEQMPYIENIKRLQATKCMLEVMQGGGHGFTLRYCEAIMYGKRIITDNPEIDKAPFYDKRFIQKFVSAENIDPAFAIDESCIVDYQYKEKLSPVRLLEFIDDKIS